MRNHQINQNILICSDQKFIKIYHSEDQPAYRTSMQMYNNFLPEKKKRDKDRQMPVDNIRNCPKHNRVLLQFNYPSSCKPKKALVIPNISDNSIAMNSRPERDTITWLSNKHSSELEGGHEHGVNSGGLSPSMTTITRLFQFRPNKSMLQEFDLVGILQKQTNFAEEFDEKQVLAVGSSKLRVLLTDEKETYLEQLEIKEIMENHTCVTQ